MGTFKLWKLKKKAKGRIVIKKQGLRSKAYCEELSHRTFLINVHCFTWRSRRRQLKATFNLLGEFLRQLKQYKLFNIALLRLEALFGMRIKLPKRLRYMEGNYHMQYIFVYHLQRIKTEKPEIFAIDYYELLKRMKKKLPDPSLEYLQYVVDVTLKKLVKSKALWKWDDIRVKILKAVDHKKLFKPLFNTLKRDRKLKRLCVINEDLLIYKFRKKKWLKAINYIDAHRAIFKTRFIWLEF